MGLESFSTPTIETANHRGLETNLPDDSGKAEKMMLPDDSGEIGYLNWPNEMSVETKASLQTELTDEYREVPFSPQLPHWYNGAEHAERPTPRESEIKAHEVYGGEEQRSFKDGQEVPYGTPGSTRPDLVRTLNDGRLEAIEVKNYDMKEPGRIQQLTNELKRQITERAENMLPDTAQRVFLDIRGQNLSNSEITAVIDKIKNTCNEVCPDLCIDVMR